MESLVCVKVNFDFADACTYFEQAQVAVLVHLIPYVSSKYLYEVTSKLPDFIQVNNLTISTCRITSTEAIYVLD